MTINCRGWYSFWQIHRTQWPLCRKLRFLTSQTQTPPPNYDIHHLLTRRFSWNSKHPVNINNFFKKENISMTASGQQKLCHRLQIARCWQKSIKLFFNIHLIKKKQIQASKLYKQTQAALHNTSVVPYLIQTSQGIICHSRVLNSRVEVHTAQTVHSMCCGCGQAGRCGFHKKAHTVALHVPPKEKERQFWI